MNLPRSLCYLSQSVPLLECLDLDLSTFTYINYIQELNVTSSEKPYQTHSTIYALPSIVLIF